MALLAVPQLASAAEGDVLLLNQTGSNMSSINMSVVPGSSNSTGFRLVAQNANITNIAIFYLGALNVSITPNNISNLAAGDFRNITLSVSLNNDTTAGLKSEKIVILTSKPERIEFPFFINVPETGSWNVTPQVLNRTVSAGEAGLLGELVIDNFGNIELNGRVSVVDLPDLMWFDEGNFTILPAKKLARPVYFAIPNGTKPDTYRINVTFFDALNNARRTNITLILPDVSAPVINLSLSSRELTPTQKLHISAGLADDVNVSSVWARIDTQAVFNLTLSGDMWKAAVENQTTGNHTILISANDSAGNVNSVSANYSVQPFNIIKSEPVLYFYRFRPGVERNLVLLSSVQETKVNVTLKSLTWSNQENNSLNVSVYGERMIAGQTKEFTASGELVMGIVGINETSFSGEIEISTSSDVANPNPTITFSGIVGNYSVSLPQTFFVAGVQIECKPNDVGVYENSSYVCTSRYPADTNSTKLAITIPKDSYEALVNGYEGQKLTLTDERDGARRSFLYAVIFAAIIIAIFLFKHFVWERTHMRLFSGRVK